MKRKCLHKKRRSKGYTKGQLNQMIDSVLHPLFEENQTLVAVDALLHGLVEQNLSESATKFLRYSLPEIVKKATACER